MDWLQELTQSESLQHTLTAFLDQHGLTGLEQALKHYTDTQQTYICKTRSSVSKIKIADIYYLEIRTHTITIHTQYETYHKYGSLADEQKCLSPYGFMKCSQNCLVSLEKIHNIRNNTIILTNSIQLHMSQRYAKKVLAAFSSRHVSRKEIG